MSSRDRFKNQYSYLKVPDSSSKKGFRVESRYIGPLYTWNLNQQEIKRYRFILAVTQIAGLLLFFMGTLLTVQVRPPEITQFLSGIAFISWVFELVATGFLCFTKLPFKEDDYLYIHSVFSRSLWIRLICMTVSFAVSIPTIVLCKEAFPDILFCICCVLCALQPLYLIKLRRHALNMLHIIEPTEYT